MNNNNISNIRFKKMSQLTQDNLQGVSWQMTKKGRLYGEGKLIHWHCKLICPTLNLEHISGSMILLKFENKYKNKMRKFLDEKMINSKTILKYEIN